MKPIYLAFCLLLSAQAFAQSDVSDNLEVYRGEGNLTATLVRILPLESNQALLKISGIDHELSGLVLKYDVTMNDGNRRLTTDLYGRRYSAFVESKNWGGKSQSLYLSGQRDGFALRFDAEASKATKSSDLLKEHKKQDADGKLAAVKFFNRDKEVKEINTAIEKIENELEQTCGKAIKVNVDWESISDDIIKEYSVSGYCANASDAIESACGDEKKKAWVTESIDSISCKFSDAIKLKLQDKELIFNTATDAPNQGDFVRQNLLNLM